tara:strand:- start:385 stop:669 length:285 start_codon:yes stop_codon:yes gene_type:complete
MSWEIFRCTQDCNKYPHSCINEDLYKTTGDAMKKHGFLDAGYEFVKGEAKRREEKGRERERETHTHIHTNAHTYTHMHTTDKSLTARCTLTTAG